MHRELLSHLSALRPLAALEVLEVVVKSTIAAEGEWGGLEEEHMAAADDLLPALPPGVKEVRIRRLHPAACAKVTGPAACEDVHEAQG